MLVWRVSLLEGKNQSLVAGFKIDSVFSRFFGMRISEIPILWPKKIENALDDRLIEESIPSFLRSILPWMMINHPPR